MKVLQQDGYHEILAYTQPVPSRNADFQTPLDVIKLAAMTCYQSQSRTAKNAVEFCRMLRERGHWSMFDHVHVTVGFFNVSRGFTHELVRHRIAAFAQESTRYVDPTREDGELNFIMPPNVNPDTQFSVGANKDPYTFREMASLVENFYVALREAGFSSEDARQILPIGTKSDIIMTADLTEWRHVFHLRCQKAAHWEIRSVMLSVLQDFMKLFHPVYDDFVIVKNQDGAPFYAYTEKGR